MTMAFFEAAADWADRHTMVLSFERDEIDGWFAHIHLQDTDGPFSANVDAIAPKRGKPRESEEDYNERVSNALSQAVFDARRKRATRRNWMLGSARVAA